MEYWQKGCAGERVVTGERLQWWGASWRCGNVLVGSGRHLDHRYYDVDNDRQNSTVKKRRKEDCAPLGSLGEDDRDTGWEMTNVGGGRKVGERKRKIAMQMEGGDTSLGSQCRNQ